MCINPFIHVHAADFNAYAVPLAYVKVNSDLSSMYPEFFGGLHRPPDIMTVMLSNNLPILLKIGIYRQIISPNFIRGRAKILNFPLVSLEDSSGLNAIYQEV